MNLIFQHPVEIRVSLGQESGFMEQNIIRWCHKCSLRMLEMKSTERLNSFFFVNGKPDFQGEKKITES